MSDLEEKRNIQALKNSPIHGRKKRDIWGGDNFGDDEETLEFLEPVQQIGPVDYDELAEAMNEAYPYYNEEKRYLGKFVFCIINFQFNIVWSEQS